jgi:heme exporter protein C
MRASLQGGALFLWRLSRAQARFAPARPGRRRFTFASSPGLTRLPISPRSDHELRGWAAPLPPGNEERENVTGGFPRASPGAASMARWPRSGRDCITRPMPTALGLHRFANPGRFLRLAEAVLPWLAGAGVILGFFGLYSALIGSPPDYQQGQSVRIMYVHVPAAWMAMFAYCVVAGASAASLIWRHPLGDLVAEAASPLGAGFTLVALISGALWGKPMWGAYWVWDARLTSFLLLFFLYLGHIALARAFDDIERGRRSAAILAVIGIVNVPIIKFSVDWWSTLHQPASILRLEGPSIDPSMLLPLLLMAGAFKACFLALVLIRVKAAVLEARLAALRPGR